MCIVTISDPLKGQVNTSMGSVIGGDTSCKQFKTDGLPVKPLARALGVPGSVPGSALYKTSN